MSADQLVQYVTWALYIAVFIAAMVEVAKHPTRVNINIALLFLTPALVIAVSLGRRTGLFDTTPVTSALSASLLFLLPYVLLRLVDDFASVPRWMIRAAEAWLLGLVLMAFLIQPPWPGWYVPIAVLYLLTLLGYAGVMFFREARHTTGVTRRRMQAAALGSSLLGSLFLVILLRSIAPGLAPLWELLSEVASLGSGIAYFLAFATPHFLRRAWQEPELRAFLARAASLPRLPDTHAILDELERGAAQAVGVQTATVGIWVEDASALRYRPSPSGNSTLDPETRRSVEQKLSDMSDGAYIYVPAGKMIAGRVFVLQESVFVEDASLADPDHADLYRAYQAKAVLAAPISAGENRLGVLTVYAPRAPLFAHDDLALVKLLADQAAVILESRKLIDEAAQVRAREEANRLKDDFLSAAAHDLRTPLTTIVAQAQLLDRRVRQNPAAPMDAAGINRIMREAKRLSELVTELLDASRVDQGRLLLDVAPVDLSELVCEACTRERSYRHRCIVDVEEPLVGQYDRLRLLQLLDNLLENAIKYSPNGGNIRVRAFRDGGNAHLTVSDQGIGILPADLPNIFNRFQRGANVDDRRFAGMGLGLYICKGIVEQHGGSIWAESVPQQGSTFHVLLPLVQSAVAPGGLTV